MDQQQEEPDNKRNYDQYYNVDIDEEIYSAIKLYAETNGGPEYLAKQLGMSVASIKGWIAKKTTRITPRNWLKLSPIIGIKRDFVVRPLDDSYSTAMVIKFDGQMKPYIAEDKGWASSVQSVNNEKKKIQKVNFELLYKLLDKTYDPYEADALINNRSFMYEKAIQELQGISLAVSYDNEISNTEIEMLLKWLAKNLLFADNWPISAIQELFLTASQKGKIDAEWKQLLLDTLKRISAGQDVVNLDFDSIDGVDFNGKYIAITGAFANGMTRNEVEELARSKGIFLNKKNGVCLSTEILIVGEKGSRAWRFGGYGRKIEAALEARKKTGLPLIISETDFLRRLENLHVVNLKDKDNERSIQKKTPKSMVIQPNEIRPAQGQIEETAYEQYKNSHPEIIFINKNGTTYKLKYDEPIIVSIEKNFSNEIRQIFIYKLEQNEFYDCYITGFCFLRKQELTFKLDQGDNNLVCYNGNTYNARDFYFFLKDQLFSKLNRTHIGNERIPLTNELRSAIQNYIDENSLKQLSQESDIPVTTIQSWICGKTFGINSANYEKLKNIIKYKHENKSDVVLIESDKAKT